jgi:Methyltransferase domain
MAVRNTSRRALQLRQFLSFARVGIRNAVLGANLASLSLVRNPRAMFVYMTESLFLFGTLTKTRGVEEKAPFEVFPSDNILTIQLANLGSGDAGQTWFGPVASFLTDIISLCLICRLVAPRVIFEIGTLNGYTTQHLISNTPLDAVLYSLDLPAEGAALQLATTFMDGLHIAAHQQSSDQFIVESSPEAARVHRLYGDSATFDYAPYEGKVDLFFIDGAHSYAYVRSDTMNAVKCCKPGSVIVWHDFGRWGTNGVSRWLREYAETHKVYAVPGGSLAYSVVE